MNQQHHIQIGTVVEETLFLLVHMVLVHILVGEEHTVLVCKLEEEGLPFFLYEWVLLADDELLRVSYDGSGDGQPLGML